MYQISRFKIYMPHSGYLFFDKATFELRAAVLKTCTPFEIRPDPAAAAVAFAVRAARPPRYRGRLQASQWWRGAQATRRAPTAAAVALTVRATRPSQALRADAVGPMAPGATDIGSVLSNTVCNTRYT